jgi:cellulose synthase/poly-beta-1,6-N-acetylglucosamine synthase-like glycosyltransferase
LNVSWFILLSIPFVFYLGFSLLFRYGLNRKYPKIQSPHLPVTVIVSARNEAKNILDCLQSLANLDYPKNLLEIIVVNDRSEDETEEIITKFIDRKSCFKYFKIKEVIPELSGKASAIAQAIRQSQGEIIFITDADCVVPQNWIKKSIPHFTDQVGMVAGFTLLDFSCRFYNKIQNLDWAYLLSVAAGAAGLGIPLTCMGNNFAFRRSAYEQVGGYLGVGFSVTEDFALLKAISQHTNWKIQFSINPECLVKTKPMKNWRDFFNQRKRWAVGGQSVHIFGKILIGINVLTNFSLIGSIIFVHNYIFILTSLLILLISDLILLSTSMKQLHAKLHLKYLPFYRIFFIFYSTVLLFNLLFNRKVTWKDIQY